MTSYLVHGESIRVVKNSFLVDLRSLGRDIMSSLIDF